MSTGEYGGGGVRTRRGGEENEWRSGEDWRAAKSGISRVGGGVGGKWKGKMRSGVGEKREGW